DEHNNTGSDKESEDPKELSAKEYRLIPMDEENPNGDNAVNLAELAGALRAKRWLIAKITCAFVLLGLLVALFSPVEYTSEALLMPEMKSSESSAGDLL